MDRDKLSTAVGGAFGTVLFAPGLVVTAPAWLFVELDQAVRRARRRRH